MCVGNGLQKNTNQEHTFTITNKIYEALHPCLRPSGHMNEPSEVFTHV